MRFSRPSMKPVASPMVLTSKELVVVLTATPARSTGLCRRDGLSVDIEWCRERRVSGVEISAGGIVETQSIATDEADVRTP